LPLSSFFYSSPARRWYVIGLGSENCHRTAGALFSRASSCPSRRFSKANQKWRDDPLGGGRRTAPLGGECCAVASAPWGVQVYGIDVDPQQ